MTNPHRLDDASLGGLFDLEENSSLAPPKRKRHTWRNVLIVVGVIVVLAVVAGVVFWQSTAGQIETIDVDVPEEGRPDAATPDESTGKAPINILMLGTDSRVSGSDSLLTDIGSRADAIMVAHIPADRSSVQVMSIMRDSWVDIPGYGPSKVNAALAYGGVSLMIQTVESLIGQRIDHVAAIDFDGFKGLTDVLGGVTVQNQVAFDSKGHDFAAGEITVSGEAALAYVRARYNFPDGDYQRVRNQQALMKGIMQKLLTRETLTNPGRITELLTTMSPYMATDSGLSPNRVIELATDLQNVRADDVSFFTMPTQGTAMMGDQSVVLVDETRMEEVRQRFANDTLDQFVP